MLIPLQHLVKHLISLWHLNLNLLSGPSLTGSMPAFLPGISICIPFFFCKRSQDEDCATFLFRMGVTGTLFHIVCWAVFNQVISHCQTVIEK